MGIGTADRAGEGESWVFDCVRALGLKRERSQERRGVGQEAIAGWWAEEEDGPCGYLTVCPVVVVASYRRWR